METRDQLLDKVAGIGKRLVARGYTLAAAESCTGGLISSVLTDVPGSSDWFTGAVVAYANTVKQEQLGVPAKVLGEHGAVSRETVEAMARGVCALLGTDVGVAVSGIAGPTGGTPDKPVGTVWMAWCFQGEVFSERNLFSGDRDQVKQQTLARALDGLAERLA